MFRRTAVSFVILLGLAGFAPPSKAQFVAPPDAPAFGRTDGVVGCDLTEAGLVVRFAQSVPSPFNGIALPGVPCLPVLAEFPPPFTAPLGFVQLNGNGSGDSVLIGADHMVWVVHGPAEPEAVIGCALNGGVLETVLVENGNGGAAAIGDPCFETLAAFAKRGGDVRGPLAATLGATGDGAGGGLMWVSKGFGFVEVVICDVEPVYGELVVTFRENSRDGLVPASIGRSCLVIIAEDVEGEALGGLPVPVPRSGSSTSDPGCLVWDVASGTILESSKPN